MAPKNKINLKDRLENGELDLSMSDLQEVPVKDLLQMKKATSLDLSNNRLTTLGKNFVTLTHVIKLDLSKNLLKELPEDFGEMRQLKHLDLYSNQISHLPLSFCELKNLRWLDLKNNPLVPAVAKIVGPCLDAQQCQQSARATVAFLSEMKQQVEEEKARLCEQQLRDNELQQEKERQQKKRNERKKAAKAKRKETYKRETERDSAAAAPSVRSQQPAHEQNHTGSANKQDTPPVTAATIPRRKLGLSMWLLLLLVPSAAVLLLFLLSASNALGPATDAYRTPVIDAYNYVLHKLPPPVQQWTDHLAIRLVQLHTATGSHIDNICVFISEVSESEQATRVKRALVQVWHAAYNQSSAAVRTFSESASLLTSHIKKIIF